MANDKCIMENGKCLHPADYTTCVNFGSPYCLWRLRWVKMPPSYAKDFSHERRRVFCRRDFGAGRRARSRGGGHSCRARFGTERDRAFIDADEAAPRAPDQLAALHG